MIFLSEVRSHLLESSHLAIFPSLALLNGVLLLNFLAESLRTAIGPKAKLLSFNGFVLNSSLFL